MPGDVPGFAALDESCDGALRVSLKDLPQSRTAGLFLFPMDLRGTVASQRDTVHIAATFVMSIFIVAAMAFGAFARGMRFRLYSFATIAMVVVFGALAGFLARPMPGPTPGLGLAERVNIYATMLWIATLAASLWRPQS